LNLGREMLFLDFHLFIHFWIPVPLVVLAFTYLYDRVLL
jgi:hypothetical protein